MPSVSIFKPSVARGGKTTKTAVWWMSWRHPGTRKQLRKSTGARRKDVAKQIARELERRLELGTWALNGPATQNLGWEELKAEFLEHKRSTSRPDTVLAYEVSLDHFDAVGKEQLIQTLDGAALQDFVKHRRDQKVAIATVNKDLRHVRAALLWAVERGYLSRCPSFKSAFIRDDRKAPVVVPRDSRAKIFAALDKPDLGLRLRSAQWWRVCLLILADLGLRRGEALGLCWGAVDLVRREVTAHAESSKGRRYRTLPLTPALFDELTTWRTACADPKDDERVLPWPKKTFRRFYDDWEVIIAAAGLPEGTKLIPKHFRSTCGSELIEAGVPTVVVKDMLGHASVTTTESHYINTRASLRAAVDKRVAFVAMETMLNAEEKVS